MKELSPAPVSPELLEAFHRALETRDFGITYQPILDVRRKRVHAYEVLSRRPSTVFRSTEEFFRTAAQAGKVGELGRLHRELAIRHCPNAPLFLNIDPNEFDYGLLVRPDDPMFLHRHAVTVEITESVPLKYFSQCHSVLAEIRRKGISLAIDDLGAGYSNLKYIVELEPQVVKFDRELIVGVSERANQRRLLAHLVQLCHELKCSVIAEGIETSAELSTMIDLGVDFVQGYLFGKPANPPPDPRWPGLLH